MLEAQRIEKLKLLRMENRVWIELFFINLAVFCNLGGDKFLLTIRCGHCFVRKINQNLKSPSQKSSRDSIPKAPRQYWKYANEPRKINRNNFYLTLFSRVFFIGRMEKKSFFMFCFMFIFLYLFVSNGTQIYKWKKAINSNIFSVVN